MLLLGLHRIADIVIPTMTEVSIEFNVLCPLDHLYSTGWWYTRLTTYRATIY